MTDTSSADQIFPGPDKPLGRVTLTVHDGRFGDELVVVAEQQHPSIGLRAAWFPVTRAMVIDASAYPSLLAGAFDRHLRPWRFPDRNSFPRMVLFPRLERLLEGGRRARRQIGWWRVVVASDRRRARHGR